MAATAPNAEALHTLVLQGTGLPDFSPEEALAFASSRAIGFLVAQANLLDPEEGRSTPSREHALLDEIRSLKQRAQLEVLRIAHQAYGVRPGDVVQSQAQPEKTYSVLGFDMDARGDFAARLRPLRDNGRPMPRSVLVVLPMHDLRPSNRRTR